MISELFASAVHGAAKLVNFSHTLVAQYCNVNGSQPGRDSCPRYFDECYEGWVMLWGLLFVILPSKVTPLLVIC